MVHRDQKRLPKTQKLPLMIQLSWRLKYSIYVSALFECLMFTCCQNIAQRGHDVSEHLLNQGIISFDAVAICTEGLKVQKKTHLVQTSIWVDAHRSLTSGVFPV